MTVTGDKTTCPNCKGLGYQKCYECNGSREGERGPCRVCAAKGIRPCPCKGIG